MIRRELYTKLQSELQTKEIVVITGPRQVGKTTAVKWLLEQTENQIYLDLTLASTRTLFEQSDYNNIIKQLEGLGIDFARRAVIAIDEIQYLKTLPEIVKYLYDNYNIKFILTGSSAFYLKNHFTESLAGRKLVFELMPLTFAEYLELKGAKYQIGRFDWDVKLVFSEFNYETLRSYYDEYVEYGGFPAVVTSETTERKRQMLDEIYSSYINLDVEQLADFKSVADLRQLVSLLAARIGSQVNVDELSKIVGLSRPTISNYISFLEQTYLIRIVSAYSTNANVRERIPKKIYFVDTGIANTNADISGGAKFENTVCHQLLAYGSAYFYNTRDSEIDFILQTNESTIALEVKETPTSKYQTVLKRRANKINISQSCLIGRYKSATFSNYLWGGQL